MTAERKPILHGSDHLPGHADPIPVVFGDVTLNAVIDGGGAILGSGVKGDVLLDRDFSIVAWTLLADTSGDAVVDVWKDVLGSYAPTGADSITGGSPPTLIGQSHARDTSLVGWTTTVDAGETLRFYVDSASAVSRLTLALTLRPR